MNGVTLRDCFMVRVSALNDILAETKMSSVRAVEVNGAKVTFHFRDAGATDTEYRISDGGYVAAWRAVLQELRP